MVMPLDSPQPTFILPPSANISATPEEAPEEGLLLSRVGPSGLPALIFGGGSLSNQYNNDSHLESLIPLRTVRTALRYGINAFDTSAYYGPSEIVLGTVLKGLEPEFPRASYQLITKCGRYGTDREAFDYSPKTIRRSVERSLSRLNTDYLDVVYLHDVEFVAEEIMPRRLGDHMGALGTEAEQYGLKEGQEAKIWGEGDQRVLGAYKELQKLQSEGVIRCIGITGYPLPTLLRLALLILHSPPFKPVDVLLSYSQSNLQNSAFAAFAPAFRERARVAQLISASPFNMGLLTSKPPVWHPAPPALRSAVKHAYEVCETIDWPGGLADVALGYAMKEKTLPGGEVPVVIGLSNPGEVHEAIRVWRDVQNIDSSSDSRREYVENTVIGIFKESGYFGWAWSSPPSPPQKD
ncbi:Aldo/keto reductase [Fomitiporia mediterranea MF3/22]|uniref:Aldo/keto reductase n=1 Tax=Fomitiporia mediterranea (strain MF3/22) TaxID=694068 RepID=UPI000440804E|nr:Aldo/keto reductase [Fomitiporia mediterranea MF3/22]EJD01295.1 Aldo/keto reductase [Fomitiporia mediterranea MF3/22]